MAQKRNKDGQLTIGPMSDIKNEFFSSQFFSVVLRRAMCGRNSKSFPLFPPTFLLSNEHLAEHEEGLQWGTSWCEEQSKAGLGT